MKNADAAPVSQIRVDALNHPQLLPLLRLQVGESPPDPRLPPAKLYWNSDCSLQDQVPRKSRGEQSFSREN